VPIQIIARGGVLPGWSSPPAARLGYPTPGPPHLKTANGEGVREDHSLHTLSSGALPMGRAGSLKGRFYKGNASECWVK
jgi:hypothetical protein